MEAVGPHDRAKALNAFKFGDQAFYWTTRICAISVLLILGGIILSLIVGAWPAMREYGFAFLWTPRWATHVFVEFERLTGDAASSPLVAQRGSANQLTIGLGATHSFDITKPW